MSKFRNDTVRTTGGNFNRLASVYDALTFAVFGQRLQRAQLVWLNRIPTGASLLIVGGGTGWLLEQVLMRCQPRRVVYLETSSRMLARASRRIIQNRVLGSVEFRVGNETDLPPDEHFDVILTPFVLDLFTGQTLQNQVIPQLVSTLETNGLWLVTDFVPPRLWWHKAFMWMMIRFFRLTVSIEAKRLADWQQLLAEAGLTLQERKLEVGELVSSEVWTKEA